MIQSPLFTLVNEVQSLWQEKPRGLAFKVDERWLQAAKDRTEFYELLQKFNSTEGNLEGPLTHALQEVERNTRTVLMVLDQENIREDNDDVIIASLPLKGRRVSYQVSAFCDDSAYGDQQSAKCFGSAFFVANGVVATAAHVVMRPGEKFEDLRFVHCVMMNGPGHFNEVIRVAKNRVFKPKNTELRTGCYYYSDAGSDFALIPVEPAFEGVPATTTTEVVKLPDLRVYNAAFQNNKHGKNDMVNRKIYSLGHGLGLPLKVSGGKIIYAPRTFPYYETHIQLLGGNSGSPVFDAVTHELIGIYIRGTEKLVVKEGRNCITVKEPTDKPPADREGQECQRLELVMTALTKCNFTLET